MENTDTKKNSRFPTVRALFSRKMLYAALVLTTLIALLYAVENFRGARAWANYRKDAEARGLKLDFAAHIPPPIPDAENGANTPWLQSWFPKPKPYDADPFWPPLKLNAEKRITKRKSDTQRHLTDLVAWQEAFAAEAANPGEKSPRKIPLQDRAATERATAALAVLEALKVYETTLNEVRASSAKPHVRYPVNYQTDEPFAILLPHLSKIKGTVALLGLKSCAELAAGRPDEAYQDVQLMIWFAESLRGETFLINQLVRLACLQLVAQTVWEGLAQHRWSDAQLQALQARLLSLDCLGQIEKSMSVERAGAIATIEWVRQKGTFSVLQDMGEDQPTGGVATAFLTRIQPRGWFRMEAANLGRVLDNNLAGVVDLPTRSLNVSKLEANQRALKKTLRPGFAMWWEHRIFATLLLPALANVSQKFSLGQNTVHQAALACALERHRLATGQFPDTLDALAPKFISPVPHDVLTGGPLKYERVGEMDFVISSVGWTQTEDGDKSSARKLRPTDWVWRSAP